VTTPGPTLSRRHALGSESARGLLFTVLGEFVLPHGRTAWTSAVIDVLGRLGVEEKASRQALMRTAADGWLRAERVGRRTRWRLTSRAEDLLTEGTDRIYSFHGAAAAWDGRWVIVLARVPESDRGTRHLLRTRLSWAGFGSPAPGVWLSTHARRAGEVAGLLAVAGVGDAQVFVAERYGEQDVTSMVAAAWDLGAIEAGYEDFIADFGSPDTSDPLTRVVELVHAWRRFPWTDPALPGPLLPAPWRGTDAADLFHDRHDAWSAAARAEWQRLNG
jgi:phenylacetic acid degradation operon negative regulatory protein